MEKMSRLYSTVFALRPQLRTLLLSLVIVSSMLFYLYYGIYKPLSQNFDVQGLDFYRGYMAAANLLDGRSVYDIPAWFNRYSYFPLSVVIYLPFSRLPVYEASLAWFALSHGLVLASFFIVYKLGATQGKLLSAAAASAAVFLSMPLYQTLQTGNINILIFSGLCLAYLLMAKNRPGLLPALLAVFASIKLAPAALAAVYLRRKDVRGLIVFVLTSLALACASLVIFGLHENLQYLKQFPELSKYSHFFHGMSLTFVSGLFLGGNQLYLILPASLALFAFLVWFWFRKAGAYPAAANGPAMAVDFFMATLVMTLTAPSIWLMYGALFTVPFYAVIHSLLSGRKGFKAVPVFVLAFILNSFWEIFYYQVPLPFANLTLRQIWLQREIWPMLARGFFSLHFLSALALFFWAGANYGELLKVFSEIFGAESERKDLI
ncbi:MAG TPA: hypothetical protein DCQ25_02870 [Elusimicrobia bacterium]|nr:hypothetical protein [Elusimicrobiota bacterium]